MAALVEERNLEQAMLWQLSDAKDGWKELGRMFQRQKRMIRGLAGLSGEERTDVERRSVKERVEELRRVAGGV